MILSLMQPYFFPYAGYFGLIDYCDLWIVFDTVQYIDRGWMNRNRILHPVEGWQYITVPVRSHARDTEIRDIEIANDQNWKKRIIGQIDHYKKTAPFFAETSEFVERSIAPDRDSLSRLNVDALSLLCGRLGIDFEYRYLSELDFDAEGIKNPDDWALRISKQMGADEYANPPGGRGLYDPVKFREEGIELTFRELIPLEYECPGYSFAPNLSIIDVMMWNKHGRIKSRLAQNGRTVRTV